MNLIASIADALQKQRQRARPAVWSVRRQEPGGRFEWIRLDEGPTTSIGFGDDSDDEEGEPTDGSEEDQESS